METMLERWTERARFGRGRVVACCALSVLVGWWAAQLSPTVGSGQSSGGVQAPAMPGAEPGEADGPNGEEAAALLVDVAGAVVHPGVYGLPEGARVRDAIRRAGGVGDDAELAAVNRAARVVDGQQVTVPSKVPVATGGGSGAATVSSAGASAPGAAVASGAKVSLNSADVAALDALPGIGPVTAERILQDRLTNGPFRDVDELDRVPGVGPGTVEQLRELAGP